MPLAKRPLGVLGPVSVQGLGCMGLTWVSPRRQLAEARCSRRARLPPASCVRLRRVLDGVQLRCAPQRRAGPPPLRPWRSWGAREFWLRPCCASPALAALTAHPQAYSTALAGTTEAKEEFLRGALDRGVTLFNSANIYTGGEELLGRAFKDRPRESYVIATKFGIKLPEFVPDLRAEAVREACDVALKRLGTTYIDLFIVCRMQTSVPLEETMGALKALVAEGKIKAVGLSEASAAQIRLAHSVCPLTAVEVEYSVWERSIEADVLPTCRELGIAVLAYSPLGRGFLTGALVSPADVSAPGPFMGKDFRAVCPRFAEDAFEANAALVKRLAALAAAKGVTTAQIALAWVHAQGPDIFPIPGTTKEANLDENLAAAAVELTADELAAIEAAVPPAEVVGTRYNAHGMSMCFEAMPAVLE